MIARDFSFALAGLATFTALPAMAQDNSREAFIERALAQSGLPPVTHEETLGHDVRQVVLRDPYGMFALPGLSLERRGDGTVFFTLHFRDWQEPPVEVPRATWEELAAMEAEVFAPPPPREPRDPDAPPPPPPPICHGWGATMAGTGDIFASWHQCAGGDEARRGYAAIFAELALSTRPDCENDDDEPFFPFMRCFSVPRFDDPELAAQFAVINVDYAEVASGAEALSAARRALREEGIAPGNDQWRSAREAIAAVRAQQDARRELIQRLGQLHSQARLSGASVGDLAKISNVIRGWNEWRDSQQTNYIHLLESLMQHAEAH